jgi:subtilisin family serine protease
MKRRVLLGFFLSFAFWAMPAQADWRFIARSNNGLLALRTICVALSCNVVGGLDGSLGQVFLVTTLDTVNPNIFLATLLQQSGIADAEFDLLGRTSDASYAIPSGLWDSTQVNYFGTNVSHGYVNQPASQIVRLSDTQSAFNVKGAGIVAVIDTGVDPAHPALQNVLVSGYDFTRGLDGMASELADVSLSTAPVVNGSQPAWVNSVAAAVIDQSTAAVVDGNPPYSAFGHGTMVAGVIHLVAPGAMIMPLKAFRADGTGYTSDIIRAIYRAVQNNAKVINMSFNLATYSQEVKQAIDFASRNSVICVAAAGNKGQNILVYPAALTNVIGVASTTNDDQRSSFSNYGQDVWVAAPGEGIITTYPFGTYAAAWGTSFSTPFVSGVAALLLNVQSTCDESQTAQSLAHAKPINTDLGNGRLDAYQAVLAWRQMIGIQ